MDRDGQVSVADSNSVERTRQKWDFDLIQSEQSSMKCPPPVKCPSPISAMTGRFSSKACFTSSPLWQVMAMSGRTKSLEDEGFPERAGSDGQVVRFHLF